MDKDNNDMTQKILNLTLKIIYLLTGEDYVVVKKSTGESLNPSSYSCLSGDWRIFSKSSTVEVPHSLIPKSKNAQKILEVTNKIIEHLTGEVPIRCQDVNVYFSMEEWEYLEGHKDLYKDVMMENQPPLTSQDVSGNKIPPKRCPHPLFSQDSTEEDDTTPNHEQHFEGQKDLNKDVMMENHPPLTSPDGSRNSQERCPHSRDSMQEGPTLPHHDQGEMFKDKSTNRSPVEENLVFSRRGYRPLENLEAIEVKVKEEEIPLEIVIEARPTLKRRRLMNIHTPHRRRDEGGYGVQPPTDFVKREIAASAKKARRRAMAFHFNELYEITKFLLYHGYEESVPGRVHEHKSQLLTQLSAHLYEMFGTTRTKRQIQKRYSDLKSREQKTFTKIKKKIRKEASMKKVSGSKREVWKDVMQNEVDANMTMEEIQDALVSSYIQADDMQVTQSYQNHIVAEEDVLNHLPYTSNEAFVSPEEANTEEEGSSRIEKIEQSLHALQVKMDTLLTSLSRGKDSS